ncbi:uridine kinase [Salinispirillum marinum]|uniref:Uridine kinase n=2 Tax=Saccharospirillaceae TaxID=255527 RepID=A0ABV8BD70_9GAMM
MMSVNAKVAKVVQLVESRLIPGQRLMLAIAGPPGSGKSTLADVVVHHLNSRQDPAYAAALLPMDGFHLDNHILREYGLLNRKGAPNTFDAPGLLSLLKQVRQQTGTLYYPLFDREQDRSLPKAGTLRRDIPIVIVEGNYLLLDAPVWREISQCFDATVFLHTPLPVLKERLLNRWIGFGFSAQDAELKAQDNDLLNAELVIQDSIHADLTLD